MANKSAAQFVREVRQESAKVTWPSRRETVMTTLIVFVMVFLVAMFLFFADQGISALIQLILGVGNG